MDQRGLALADLAQEHIDDWIAGATSQRRYLIRYFLKWTTKPISTHGMTQKLGRDGIPVSTARNTALVALAADLPSPILVDVTGMHCHTALRWVAYAKRDWAEYLAARTEDQQEGGR